MKKIICIAIIAISITLLCTSIGLAHPGRTDSNGGHWNHKEGTYHYHSAPGKNASATRKPAAQATPKPDSRPEDIYVDVWYGETSEDNVYIYEYASFDANTLTTIKKAGTEIVVVDVVEDEEYDDIWWYVVWFNGEEGYVLEEYVYFREDDDAA